MSSNGTAQTSTTGTILSNVTYNVDGAVSSWQWSDGLLRSIGYDAYGQVASYTLANPNGSGNAKGVLRTLTRDAAGRITGYTEGGVFLP